MKEITMKTKIIETGYVFEEKYEISDKEDPKEYAEDLIKNYNATLRPYEKLRALVDVFVSQGNVEGKQEHNWEKQNLVTIRSGGKIYDIYKCTCCGITGKRYGLSEKVMHDPKYNGDKYRFCQNS